MTPLNNSLLSSYQIRHERRNHDRDHEAPHTDGHDAEDETREGDVGTAHRVLADDHAGLGVNAANLVGVEHAGYHSWYYEPKYY